MLLLYFLFFFFFFFNDTATTEIYTLSLHDALPIPRARQALRARDRRALARRALAAAEEHLPPRVQRHSANREAARSAGLEDSGAEAVHARPARGHLSVAPRLRAAAASARRPPWRRRSSGGDRHRRWREALDLHSARSLGNRQLHAHGADATRGSRRQSPRPRVRSPGTFD